MRKILTFLFAALMSVGTMFADGTKIGDLYYNLNAGNNTAEVTYQVSMSDANYSSLTAVNIPESVEYNSVTYTVTSIGESAFYLCYGLTSVTIPNTVTSIGMAAFGVCEGLTSVTIPSGASIGMGAFFNCSGLTRVTNYAVTPQMIEDYAFKNVNKSSCTLYVPEGSISLYSAADYWKDFTNIQAIGDEPEPEPVPEIIKRVQIGNLYYNLNVDNKTAEVTSQNSSYPYWSTTITTANIPSSVTYNSVSYSVTSIGNSAFYTSSGLTSVTIPNTVTSIGVAAFYGCTGFTSLTIPNSVTSIGQLAFFDCSSLTSVTIGNSVTSIGEEAFEMCSALTSITIPNSVTSIGESAFMYCYGLTSIVVESENTTYDSRENCNAIIETSTNTLIAGCQNTIIPNSVTSIGYAAFYGCYGLTSITIPDNVTSIGKWAFRGCEGLTSITIPSSVTSIAADAFLFCTNITDVYCYADPNNLTWNDGYCDDFKNADHATFCHVKACALATYEANWGGTEYNKKTSTGVNVTFKGDLPGDCPAPTPTGVDITANLDPQNAGVYYSTFYHGSVDYALPANVKAYKAAISGNDLLLSEVAAEGDVLPKGNAVILRSSVQNYTLTPSDATPVSVGDDNDLEGVDVETAVTSIAGLTTDNCYVLSGTNEHGVGFYRINSNNLKAHKAYVKYSGTQNNAPRRMRFVFEQEQVATGLDNANADIKAEKRIENGQLIIIKNGVRYNAQGQLIK